MKTIYEKQISNDITSDYIDILINKVFALLPMYEEAKMSETNMEVFKNHQRFLIQTINGNTKLVQYENIIVLDILSHLQSLYELDMHDDYRRHILKICKLLNLLKEDVEKNGL